jgi:GMP synthase (glutamine-hydrolysing)
MVELIYHSLKKEFFFEGVSENSQVWMSHSDSIKAAKWSKMAST